MNITNNFCNALIQVNKIYFDLLFFLILCEHFGRSYRQLKLSKIRYFFMSKKFIFLRNCICFLQNKKLRNELHYTKVGLIDLKRRAHTWMQKTSYHWCWFERNNFLMFCAFVCVWSAVYTVLMYYHCTVMCCSSVVNVTNVK